MSYNLWWYFSTDCFFISDSHASQVLDSLKVAPAAPFALQQQYVPAILAARVEAGEPIDEPEDADDDGDKAPPPPKSKSVVNVGKSVKRKDPPQDVAQPAAKSEWTYRSARKDFIDALRKDGLSYGKAVAQWDVSMEKARLLGPLTIGELKKRRFLDKTAKGNPWFKKLQNPTNWVGSFAKCGFILDQEPWTGESSAWMWKLEKKSYADVEVSYGLDCT